MDILEKNISILISLAIFGQAYFLRKRTGSWSTPASIFSLFWFIFTFVPLVLLYEVPINAFAILYIFFFCLMFNLSALGFKWRTAFTVNNRNAVFRRKYLSNNYMRVIFTISLLVSIFFVIVDLFIQGLSINQFFNNFLESSNRYLELRYEGEVKKNLFSQLGLVLAYICVIIGGFLHSAEDTPRKKNIILIKALTPSVLIMLFQSAKGLFFVSIAILIGGSLLHHVMLNKHPFTNIIIIRKYSKLLLLLIPLIITSFLSRGLYSLDTTGEIIQSLRNYLASYAFMHVYAFSDWFNYLTGGTSFNHYNPEELTGGFYNFTSVFKLLGSNKVVLAGIYDEYYQYKEIRPGNIYTIFRGAIQDFSIIGSLIFSYILGLIFNFSYYYLLNKKKPLISIAIYITMINFTYTSYIISTFIWNSTYVVFLLMCIVLFFNKILSRKTSTIKIL